MPDSVCFSLANGQFYLTEVGNSVADDVYTFSSTVLNLKDKYRIPFNNCPRPSDLYFHVSSLTLALFYCSIFIFCSRVFVKSGQTWTV